MLVAVAAGGGSVRRMSDAALKTSPLHDRHVALGAKMADFGGWEMPIEYPGGGVVREHTAVRSSVGHLRRLPPRQGARLRTGRARAS